MAISATLSSLSFPEKTEKRLEKAPRLVSNTPMKNDTEIINAALEYTSPMDTSLFQWHLAGELAVSHPSLLLESAKAFLELYAPETLEKIEKNQGKALDAVAQIG